MYPKEYRLRGDFGDAGPNPSIACSLAFRWLGYITEYDDLAPRGYLGEQIKPGINGLDCRFEFMAQQNRSRIQPDSLQSLGCRRQRFDPSYEFLDGESFFKADRHTGKQRRPEN